MIKYLQKTVALIGVFLVGIAPGFSQIPAGRTPQDLVESFLYELYQTDQDALAIAKKYIFLQEIPNDFSLDARYKGGAEHLTMLRQGQTVGQATEKSNEPIVFNKKNYKVIPYNQLNAPRLAVSLTKEQEDNLYVLTEKGKPLRYFILRDNKILSFDYMKKDADGPAYFLGY